VNAVASRPWLDKVPTIGFTTSAGPFHRLFKQVCFTNFDSVVDQTRPSQSQEAGTNQQEDTFLNFLSIDRDVSTQMSTSDRWVEDASERAFARAPLTLIRVAELAVAVSRRFFELETRRDGIIPAKGLALDLDLITIK
jgi:hypothetical protein